MLYVIENLEKETFVEYIRKFKKASSFVHVGFQHILDTSIEENSICIVLEHKSGSPLIQQLKQQEWTFPRIITLISDLGVSMLDGMEEQITGFSVGVDNLWLSEDDRLSFINFWEDGELPFTGPLGLCSLIIQLSSGSTQIPDPFTALDNYLLQFDLLQASTEQKSALIKLVRRAYHGQVSLSSLVIGLQGLLHIKNQFEKIQAVPVTDPVPAAIPISRNQTQQPAAIPYNLEIIPPETEDDEEEEINVPFYKRKISVVLGLIVAAFLIWMIWPSLQTPKKPADSSPAPSTQSSIPPSATPVPTPTNDNSVIGPGQDTTVPNLIGMKESEAGKKAISAGLHYNFHREVNAKAESGTVFKQVPPADTKAVQGDNVTFWVSK
jgi:hypothetical protein